MKTFNPGNNLKWNYEALALQIKVKSNKKRHPLTYSGCLKLRVCNNFTIDLNGRILLRSGSKNQTMGIVMSRLNRSIKQRQNVTKVSLFALLN